MTAKALARIFRDLNEAEVRYLVVGGLAVVAHGYLRFTKDLDLVLDFADDNVRQAVGVLESLDYRPQIPVSLSDLGSRARRREWVEEKNARVLTLFSDQFPGLTVDALLQVPFDFKAAFARRWIGEIDAGVEVSFLGLEDLLAMKEAAGRPQDLVDVHKLRLLAASLESE